MAKFSAKGAQVYLEVANPPTVLIGQMGDSEFDTGERDPVLDVTDHENTDQTRDSLDNGLKKAPSVRGQIFLDPSLASHEALRSKQKTHDSGLYCKVVLPDAGAAQWVFKARVQSFGVGLPVGDKLAANIVIEGMDNDTFTA